MRATPKFKVQCARRFVSLLNSLPLIKQAELQILQEIRAKGVRVNIRTVKRWVDLLPS